jgi:hypothetical protein
MDAGDWPTDVEPFDALELLVAAAARWAMRVKLERRAA